MKRPENSMKNVSIFFVVLVLWLPLSDAEIAVVNKDNATVAVFFDIEVGLGAKIDNDGLVGRLHIASPEDACSPMHPAPNKTDPTEKWFALCRRYNCSFALKMKNARDAGYHGLIVYNVENTPARNQNVSTTHLLYFGENNSEFPQFFAFKSKRDIILPGIPTVLVSGEDGLSLKNYYTYDKGYIIIISPDFGQSLINYLLPFAAVIGICLLIMISFMIIKCLRDRRRSRRHRLSSKHLKKLPTTKFKKGDHYDTCAICLDEYVEGEKLRVLPCGHVYHIKCIDPWLTKNRRVCPVCKAKVVLPGMTDITDSESEAEAPATERTPLVQSQRRIRRTRRPRRNGNNRQPNSPPDSATSRPVDDAGASTSGEATNGTFPITSGHLSVNCDERLESQPPDSRQPSFSNSVTSTVTVVEVEADSNEADTAHLISSTESRSSQSRRDRRGRRHQRRTENV